MPPIVSIAAVSVNPNPDVASNTTAGRGTSAGGVAMNSAGLWPSAIKPPSARKDREVIEGDVVIRNAADMAKLRGVLYIAGNVLIANTNLKTLAGLKSVETIDGSLIIENNPRLEDVSALEEHDDRFILTVWGRVVNENNPKLPNDLRINEWDFFHLRSKLDLEILRRINPETIAKLDIRDSNFKEIDLGFVKNIRELEVVGNDQLRSLKINNVEKIESGIKIVDNPVLKNIEMNALRTTHWLDFIGDNALKTISLPSLRRVSTITMNDNAVLNHIDLPALRKVEGKNIHILNNPKLSNDAALAFVERFRSAIGDLWRDNHVAVNDKGVAWERKPRPNAKPSKHRAKIVDGLSFTY